MLSLTPTQLVALAGPVITWGLTELCKRLNAVKLSANAKQATQLIAAAFGALSLLLYGVAGASVDPVTVTGATHAVMALASFWGGAELIHRLKSWAVSKLAPKQ